MPTTFTTQMLLQTNCCELYFVRGFMKSFGKHMLHSPTALLPLLCMTECSHVHKPNLHVIPTKTEMTINLKSTNVMKKIYEAHCTQKWPNKTAQIIIIQNVLNDKVFLGPSLHVLFYCFNTRFKDDSDLMTSRAGKHLKHSGQGVSTMPGDPLQCNA